MKLLLSLRDGSRCLLAPDKGVLGIEAMSEHETIRTRRDSAITHMNYTGITARQDSRDEIDIYLRFIAGLFFDWSPDPAQMAMYADKDLEKRRPPSLIILIQFAIVISCQISPKQTSPVIMEIFY
jgi:hypothetical protein